MQICVYTASYGGAEHLTPPVPQSVPTDFVCFTDSATLRPAGAWRVVRDARNVALHPRLRTRWCQTHPHLLFPRGRPAAGQFAALDPRNRFRRYTHTIWLDPSLRVTGRHLAYDLAISVGDAGLALFAHPDRDCIYDEAAESLRWSHFNGQNITEQVEHYRSEGFPPHHGLWAAIVIARRTGVAGLAALDEAWWQEIERWTHQDQLSLPVVLRRHGVQPDRIDAHLWNNPWFEWAGHQVDEGSVTTKGGTPCTTPLPIGPA